MQPNLPPSRSPMAPGWWRTQEAEERQIEAGLGGLLVASPQALEPPPMRQFGTAQPTQRWRVLDFLRQRPASTTEIAEALSLDRQQVSMAINGLVTQRRVVVVEVRQMTDARRRAHPVRVYGARA